MPGLITGSGALTRADQEVYAWIVATLPWGNCVHYIDQHDFGNVFLRKVLDGPWEIWNERRNPQREFVDPTLESLRADLVRHLGVFLEETVRVTRSANREGTLQKIPREWHDDGEAFDHDWFEENRRLLNVNATKMVDAYRRLIIEARTRLP